MESQIPAKQKVIHLYETNDVAKIAVIELSEADFEKQEIIDVEQDIVEDT